MSAMGLRAALPIHTPPMPRDPRHSRPNGFSRIVRHQNQKAGMAFERENTMRTMPNINELSLDQLDQVVGGAGNFGVSGHIGTIAWGTKPNGGTSVTWPGSVGGVNGYWSVSSDGGVQWHGKP